MRWLFLILLVINLAYIAWQVTMPVTDLYAGVQPLKNVQTIVLLRERAAADEVLVLQEAAYQDEAMENLMAEPAASEAPVEDMVAVDPPVQAKNKVAMVAEAKAQDIENPSQKKLEQDKRIQARPVQDKPLQIESCFTLGPFRDLEELRRLTRELKTYVTTTDFRGKEEKGQPLYWVYIKPEKSRKKAVEIGKQLKAKKIKDFYVIRDGEKVNGISLGHFRNKGGAYGLLKKVKKLGFNVTVELVRKVYTVYWLDYQLGDGVSVPESILAKMLKSARKDKINRLTRDCET